MSNEFAVIEAKKSLKQLIKPGDTVFANIVSVARSGMSRRMTFHVPVKTNSYATWYDARNQKHRKGKRKLLSIQDITHWVSLVVGRDKKDGSIVYTGCGMDMVAAAVTELSKKLFDEYVLKSEVI